METSARHPSPAVRWAACLCLGLCLIAATWSPGTPTTSAAAPVPSTASLAAQGRPNIVLITTDDQTMSDMRVMRHVQSRMTRRGVSFTNSIAPSPLCCPSRASMLTGQYAHNHGVRGNSRPWGGFDLFDDRSNVATWLQEAGYTTAFIGKYLNHYGSRDPRYIPPGWSYWAAAIRPSAKYVNFKLNVGGVRKHVPRRYKTTVFNQMAVSFVDRQATSETPFFLWLSHVAPHSGGPEERDDPSALGLTRHNHTPAVSAKYRNAYNHMRLPQPPGFNEANVKDKPRYVRRKHRLDPKTMSAIEETIQQRREALLSVDDGVDAILNALQRNGELGRTLVVFTSDNGMMNGQHRLRNKYYPYTPSIRVPLIIRGPGVPTGARRSQPVGTIDLAPTITDAAGIAPSAVVDGRSLLPLASSGAVGTHRTMLLELGEAPHGLNTWPTAFYTGVRTRRWVYLEYGTGERELYNQARDPHQLRSKHTDPDLRDVRRRLAGILNRLRDCAGPSCR